MRRRCIIVALAIVAAGALLPTTALPATATLDGTTIRVVAAPGEANAITITATAPSYGVSSGLIVQDTGAPLTVTSPACEQVTPSSFRCDAARRAVAALGDGDDRFTAEDVTRAYPLAGPVSMTTVVDGGPGNDVIVGSQGSDRLDGGLGDDVVHGLGGGDELGGGDLRLGTDAGHDLLAGDSAGEYDSEAPDTVYDDDGPLADRLEGDVLVYGTHPGARVDLERGTTTGGDALRGFSSLQLVGGPATATGSLADLAGGDAADTLRGARSIDGGDGADALVGDGRYATIIDRDRSDDLIECRLLDGRLRTVAVETWPRSGSAALQTVPRSCALVRDRSRLSDPDGTRSVRRQTTVDPAIHATRRVFRVRARSGLDTGDEFDDPSPTEPDIRNRTVPIVIADAASGAVLARGRPVLVRDWRRCSLRPTAGGRALLSAPRDLTLEVRAGRLRFRTVMPASAIGGDR